MARSTLPLLVWTVSIQAAYATWFRPVGAPWAVPGWALLLEYGALAIAGACVWVGARRDGAGQLVTPPDGAP